MKALRKSLNKDSSHHHHQISTPLPPISKPSPSISPPQKVIRATTPYRSRAPQELSFGKGDFFYVVREVSDNGAWYEAHNPMTGARGLVPRAMFEEFAKGSTPNARTSQAIPVAPVRSSTTTPRAQAYYALVLHDFMAERPDELDAKAGDSISVVAQSNREWFVAKPIGRLGKPGLIPVTFVQIRDPLTNQPIDDVDALMDSGRLPRVEDWKRQIMSYKANSIPLGIIDDPTDLSSPGGVKDSQFTSLTPISPVSAPASASAPTELDSEPPLSEAGDSYDDQARPPTPTVLPEGLLLSAAVTSFHFENDDYWFRIEALYQPFDPSGTTSLPPARELTIFRAYNDFFEYQTALLDAFPSEAGRAPPHPRILPYMPGPAPRVDDRLSAARRLELHEYLNQLSRLNRTTARYILEHTLTRVFFAAKPGDLDHALGPQYEVMADLNWYDPVDEPVVVPATPAEAYTPSPAPAEDIIGRLSYVKLQPPPDSDGSDYGEDVVPAVAPNGRMHSHSKSTISARGPSPLGHAPRPSYAKNGPATYERDSAYSHSSTSSSSRWPDHAPNSHSTHATSPTTTSSRSQSHSRTQSQYSQPLSPTATNAPPISAQNPQTAFIKIKIFDRVQDDLIAIRVHPRVSHGQLMDKVRQRLGAQVRALSFREGTEDYVPLHGDAELTEWLESTDRHVLYAD